MLSVHWLLACWGRQYGTANCSVTVLECYIPVGAVGKPARQMPNSQMPLIRVSRSGPLKEIEAVYVGPILQALFLCSDRLDMRLPWISQVAQYFP